MTGTLEITCLEVYPRFLNNLVRFAMIGSMVVGLPEFQITSSYDHDQCISTLDTVRFVRSKHYLPYWWAIFHPLPSSPRRSYSGPDMLRIVSLNRPELQSPLIRPLVFTC